MTLHNDYGWPDGKNYRPELPVVRVPTINPKRKRLWEYDVRCRYCLVPMNFEDSTVDHIIPQSLGGSNVSSNLTLACYDCNQKKGNDIWEPKFRP